MRIAKFHKISRNFTKFHGEISPRSNFTKFYNPTDDIKLPFGRLLRKKVLWTPTSGDIGRLGCLYLLAADMGLGFGSESGSAAAVAVQCRFSISQWWWQCNGSGSAVPRQCSATTGSQTLTVHCFSLFDMGPVNDVQGPVCTI